MMGPKQEALFYEFSLEEYVPQDHLLWSIDRFVDLSGIHAHLSGLYSHTGRPSIDPDPYAVGRLLPRYPVKTSALRGNLPEPRLPLVPPLRSGRASSKPLGLFQEPPLSLIAVH